MPVFEAGKAILDLAALTIADRIVVDPDFPVLARREIDNFLDRIVETSNPSIVELYDKRISELQSHESVTFEKLDELGKKQPSFE